MTTSREIGEQLADDDVTACTRAGTEAGIEIDCIWTGEHTDALRERLGVDRDADIGTAIASASWAYHQRVVEHHGVACTCGR